MREYSFYIDEKKTRLGYTKDLSIREARESGQMFFRKSLSESVKFVGADFDYIMSKPITHYFSLRIFNSDGILIYRGGFVRTDAEEIDIDNKKITMPITTIDQYTEILKGLEREEDLIKIGLPRTKVSIDRRPIAQFYIPGDGVLTSITGGNYWEQDVNSTTDHFELFDDYKFKVTAILKEIKLTASGFGALAAANGVYVGAITKGVLGYHGTLLNTENETYKVDFSQRFAPSSTNPTVNSEIEVRLKNANTGQELYRYISVITVNEGVQTVELLPAAGSGMIGKMIGDLISYRVYSRYLLDVDFFNGNPTLELPEDDITGEHYNYRKVYEFGIENTARISSRLSDEPTIWGMNPEGKYYLPPDDDPNYFPLARSRWGYASIWYINTPLVNLIEPYGIKSFYLKDAYLISDVISALAGKISANYKHEGTPEYSRILYDKNPLTAVNSNFRLLITPKSNAMLGEYDRPAERAPLTLKNIFDFLKNLKIYWWVDEENNLRLEHYQYFKNGGSYSSKEKIISVNLEEVCHTHTRKRFDFQLNKFKYKKDEIPERYEFRFSDDVSKAFQGNPIVVKSAFAQEGRKEDINISIFNPDIDLLMINSSGVSKDGFAIFAANFDPIKGYYLPYVNLKVNGVTVAAQNGFLSIPWIQENLFLYGMPPGDVEVEGEMRSPYSYVSTMVQNGIKIPTFEVLNPGEIIATALGFGEIENVNYNLLTSVYELTLNYESE